MLYNGISYPTDLIKVMSITYPQRECHAYPAKLEQEEELCSTWKRHPEKRKVKTYDFICRLNTKNSWKLGQVIKRL